jgi:23S rRNA pseudouridine1911/1915/1917 synthase
MDQIESIRDQILFEDNHLIIINKKPSEIVQGDKTGDASMIDTVKLYIKYTYQKPGNVFLGLVHRIDRPVSGAVIFAKTSKSLSRLNEQIKNREVTKTYWAITKKAPPKEEDQITHWLVKDEARNKSRSFKTEQVGTKKAELKYKLISKSKDYNLLEVDLITGRHHQIRVQLSEIGCPIKGDLKYGFARSNKDASISLHARKLSFIHPVKKEKMEIIAPPPKDALWDFFVSDQK